MERDLGRLEGKVEAVEKEMAEIKGDVKAILALVNQSKGGWKTITVVGAISGTVGAFIAQVLPFFHGPR